MAYEMCISDWSSDVFSSDLHQSSGYQPDYPSSFYVSNDQWHKGEEITIFPDERRKTREVKLMSNARLSKFIEDPHQKFYYIFNFQRPLDFLVELIKISKIGRASCRERVCQYV